MESLTGRLRKFEPDMQNVPIRTEEGTAIRNALIRRSDAMSMSSIYCYGTDGRLYANPVIFSDDWYIIMDDREPPELVMTKNLHERSGPAVVLQKFGIKASITSSQPCGDRLFPPYFKVFKHAVSFFIRFEGDVIPIVDGVSLRHNGTYASVEDVRTDTKIEGPRER